MNGYYQQIKQALQNQGFCFLRAGKGSHEIWSKDNLRIIVPFNCPSRHTANAVMKQAGLKHKF